MGGVCGCGCGGLLEKPEDYDRSTISLAPQAEKLLADGVEPKVFVAGLE